MLDFHIDARPRLVLARCRTSYSTILVQLDGSIFAGFARPMHSYGDPFSDPQ